MVYKTFQISGDLFWGWQSKIDIEHPDYNTIEKVISRIKMDLIQYLNKGGLVDLIEKVKAAKFHCHDNIDDIFINKIDTNTDTDKNTDTDTNTDKDKIIYICDHC
uniref:Uncharacterized protein n=1 Tax=viral metagenome TaxID=1070528 RepID=A0A6C0KXE1_9ZZZZ